MNRREIVYDVFLGVGRESWRVARGVSREEALEAKELLQGVRVEPRIVSDFGLEFDREPDEPDEK